VNTLFFEPKKNRVYYYPDILELVKSPKATHNPLSQYQFLVLPPENTALELNLISGFK